MSYDFATLAPAYGQENMMWKMLKSKGIDDADVIDFGVAEMKFPLAPEIKAAVAGQSNNGTFGYAFTPKKLSSAVCQWMELRHGWHIEPEWSQHIYGVVSGIGYSLRALTKPGDGVAIMLPSYGPFPRQVLGNERRLVTTDLISDGGRYVIDFDDFEKKLADPYVTALILCNPHNPTGRVWTKDELVKIGGLCLKHDVKIISDDIHLDIVFSPHRYTPIVSLSNELADITVTLTAPSKTFNMAGMTFATITAPNPELREKIFKVIEVEMGHYINSFGFAGAYAAYAYGGSWLDAALDVLKGNADFLRVFMAERLPAVKIYEQEGTYLCWADYSGLRLEPEQLNALLHGKSRFMSQAGTDFGSDYGQFHRINVACPRAYLEKALCRFEDAAKSEGLL